MVIHFTPDQEVKLAQIASKSGIDAEDLVKDAALSLLTKGDITIPPVSPGSVVAEMRAIRARIKPDPEGWTTREYVQYGRR